VDHVTFSQRPPLDHPALVCAFTGWNDGGEAASVAARYLAEQWGAQPIATIDPEEFYDFQVNRPTVRLEQGVSRVIEWPKAEFTAVTGRERDVVLFTAPEPNVRWRTFAQTVVGVGRELGAGLLLTLGAFLTDVPHTRPVPVVGSALDEETAAGLGLARSQYEGPTGITGVVHDVANRAGLPSVSLWAAVPHYLPAAPNPKAALALVRRASALLGVPVDAVRLAEASAAWETTVVQLVEQSDELGEYVGRLESAADEAAQEASSESDLPGPEVSGDSIAAEVERFLREQGNR
jgi:predicted ATP-grasp superfamily ATP-dependent carboligase